MRVLIACEFSGIVRDAFRSREHDAWSCDLLPCEKSEEYHLQCDVRDVLNNGWELMVGHPPCTHLAVSGAAHFKYKEVEQIEGAEFFLQLVTAPISKIAIENPVCVMSSIYRKPDQIIQPWMFGHGETKATCLWLKNLPLLLPTIKVWTKREQRIHKLSPFPDRWKERSRTYTGIAQAMAEQWGSL